MWNNFRDYASSKGYSSTGDINKKRFSQTASSG